MVQAPHYFTAACFHSHCRFAHVPGNDRAHVDRGRLRHNCLACKELRMALSDVERGRRWRAKMALDPMRRARWLAKRRAWYKTHPDKPETPAQAEARRKRERAA